MVDDLSSLPGEFSSATLGEFQVAINTSGSIIREHAEVAMIETVAPKAERQQRRSERTLLRIPIQVGGKDTGGKPFRETTYTLVINRHGARIRSANGVLPGGIFPSAPSSVRSSLFSPGGEERRREKRLVAKLPAGIRRQHRGKENTATESLSNLGICFSSNLVMDEGDSVFLMIESERGGHKQELPAQIVWRRPLDAKGRALHRVRLRGDE